MRLRIVLRIVLILTLPALLYAAAPAEMPPETPRPTVTLDTSLGTIQIELRPDKAPLSVKNFLRYVDEGFYNGTIFHRVMPNFMIQGGGFTPELRKKQPHAPIKNEADNSLRNARGAVALARTRDIDSANSQFFINLVDNQFLDHGIRDWGYCVFGRVIRGMDIVDKIGSCKTGYTGRHQNVPLEPILITRAYRTP